MKKSKLLLILLLSFHLSFSQKIVKYNYVVNGKSIDNRKKPFLGMESEFSTVRKYYNIAQFKESRLFTGSSKDFILYKVIDQVWYYKSNSKWKLFFDYRNGRGGKIHLSGYDCQITLEKEVTIRDKKLYKISLQPVNITISHKPVYFFDPNEGVIIVKVPSGIILTRDDYFKNQLSDDEISLL